MSGILCSMGWHKPRVRFAQNGRFKMGRPLALVAIAICDRCGKELSPPAQPPRGTK